MLIKDVFFIYWLPMIKTFVHSTVFPSTPPTLKSLSFYTVDSNTKSSNDMKILIKSY